MLLINRRLQVLQTSSLGAAAVVVALIDCGAVVEARAGDFRPLELGHPKFSPELFEVLHHRHLVVLGEVVHQIELVVSNVVAAQLAEVETGNCARLVGSVLPLVVEE